MKRALRVAFSYAASDSAILGYSAFGVLSAMVGAQLAFFSEPIAPAPPYMDEEFHAPQAQVICAGDFVKWDPKITTLPGLYYASASMIGLTRLLGSSVTCSVRTLRTTQLAFACFFLVALAFVASLALLRLKQQRSAATPAVSLAPSAATTALWLAAIGSFPVLFLCGVLYYTDVLSAATVLASAGAAGSFAWRLDAPLPSVLRAWTSAVLALAAAFVRQSNVIWAALVACTIALQVWLAAARSARVGRLLSRAGLQVLLSSWRPVAARLLPFALLGIASIAFVAVNGGVVVGDKASHAPVLHLAQLGYACGIWALYLIGCDGADFALRLLIAGRHALTPQQNAWLACLRSWLGLSVEAMPASRAELTAVSLVTHQPESEAAAAASTSAVAADAGADVPEPPNSASSSHSGPRSRGRASSRSRKHGAEAQAEPPAVEEQELSPSPVHPSPVAGGGKPTSGSALVSVPSMPPVLTSRRASQTSRVAVRLAVLAAAVAVAAGLIDAFTFEHEYLLSDNRHYAFYLWRRIMKPHRWLRAGLAVVYVAGAVLLAARIVSASTLYLQSDDEDATSAATSAAPGAKSVAFSPAAAAADAAAQSTASATDSEPEPAVALDSASKPLPGNYASVADKSSAAPVAAMHLHREAAALWFAAFFVATALAVVPSRLLEPRYFILTTIVALLNAPPDSPIAPALMLAAHIVVNAGTLWLFIFKPFTWSDGSIARFMW